MGRNLQTLSEYDQSAITYPRKHLTLCVLGYASMYNLTLIKTKKNSTGCKYFGLLL